MLQRSQSAAGLRAESGSFPCCSESTARRACFGSQPALSGPPTTHHPRLDSTLRCLHSALHASLHSALHASLSKSSRFSFLTPACPPFASTHPFVACFHARRPVAVPSSSAPAKLLDVVSARHVPWLYPLLPCVCGCTRPTRHLTSSATPSPPLSLPTRPDQGKGPKIDCIGAFLAPIPSRQTSPNSVHITDKCFVVGTPRTPRTQLFSLESVPGPRMESPANYPSMCIYPLSLTPEDVALSSVLPEAIAKRAVEIEPRIPAFSVQPVPYFGEMLLLLSRRCWQHLQGTLHQQLHPGLRVQRYKLTEMRQR
jgi:hypothetical protein